MQNLVYSGRVLRPTPAGRTGLMPAGFHPPAAVYMAASTQTYETINADAIITFFSTLLSALPGITLNIILDQARYHACAVVAAWVAENPGVNLHFLAAYSPNLNTIESPWKLMREFTLNNVFAPAFKIFT